MRANKTAFALLDEAVNSRDLELIGKTVDEVCAPDMVFHTRAPFGAPGPQMIKQVWAILLRAYPDIRVKAEDVIVDGDKAVYRNTVTGTNLGEYRGKPPTGKSVTYDEIFIVRHTAGGRIAEIWGVVDVYSQLAQLGHIAP